MSSVIVPEIKKELWEAYDNLISAQAKESTTRLKLEPKLDAIAKKFSFPNHLLEENKDSSCRRGFGSEDKIITSAKDMYMASEEDSKKFFSASTALYNELGYDVKDGYCPILVSHSLTLKAEVDFINKSFYLVAKTNLEKEAVLRSVEYRKRYINLTMNILESVTHN